MRSKVLEPSGQEAGGPHSWYRQSEEEEETLLLLLGF